MTIKILFVFLIFLSGLASGQTFDPTLKTDRATISGDNLEGWATYFTYSAKDVEKAWWKYCKSFGRPLNMKSYYQVTIPGDAHQNTEDLVLLSRTYPTKAGSKFFLTVQIPHSQKKESYLRQTKKLLQDFKQRFYLDRFLESLEELQEEAEAYSQDADPGNEQHMKRIQKYASEVDELMFKIKEVYQAY